MRIDLPSAALQPTVTRLNPGAALPEFALAMDLPPAVPPLPRPTPAPAMPLAPQRPVATLLMQVLGQPPPAHWRLRELDPASYAPAQPDPEMPQTLSLELRLVSSDGHALPARLVLSVFALAREQAPGLVEALRRHDASAMPGPILDRTAAELAGTRHGFEWTADGRALWQAQALAMRGWLQVRPRELPRKPGAALSQPAEPGEFDPEPMPAGSPPMPDDGAPVLGVGQWLWLSAKGFGSWLKTYW
ncbi:hypothetical protein C3942_05025 [Solimonas fluminis]|uniref:Uncharacterized protein n=1 Tax=Solimonas fluminis TaxID=2086571 RepID=A0A2S5TJ75_9GAMM|nr:hypothetical protein [Solimonas fluminis]PPE75040.1 hypothetical protein C3942_05025 [Solimonas fluminis]